MAIFAVKGLFRGLIREVFSLVALAGGIAAAVLFGQDVARESSEMMGLHIDVANVIGRGLLFIVIYSLVQIVGIVVHRFGKAAQLGSVNRTAGGLFGILAGGIVAAGGIYVIKAMGWAPDILKDSVIAEPMAEFFRHITEWASKRFS